jgi:hypothetical protein
MTFGDAPLRVDQTLIRQLTTRRRWIDAHCFAQFFLSHAPWIKAALRGPPWQSRSAAKKHAAVRIAFDTSKKCPSGECFLQLHTISECSLARRPYAGRRCQSVKAKLFDGCCMDFPYTFP